MSKKNNLDVVNHPSHYTFGKKYEVIDVIEDWNLSFAEGSTLKYLARFKYKGNPLEDLKKARFYLNRLIKQYEKEGTKDEQEDR